MSDFLDSKQREINDRLKELRPLVDEYHRLEAAAAALASVGNSGPSRRARSTASTTAPRRPGRRRGSGTRAAQALSLVQANPGITIPELATRMKIKQNYLYRVMPGLEQDGKVRREGRGWHVKS